MGYLLIFAILIILGTIFLGWVAESAAGKSWKNGMELMMIGMMN